ncbi:DUF3228 family protein [Candidatus Dojkabacteria bacterium]|jgi:hypothetical protein|nr:DUF3228 family protein [Candidatus Dojkabacteria bacterium]
MKIKLTDFALRHFDTKFGGTKILNHTANEFQNRIDDAFNTKMQLTPLIRGRGLGTMFVFDGYAPFCKLLAITNFTDARVGSLPITLENYQYIRSGYSARRDDELPVFSRWLELPLGRPKADWLVLVLYSHKQLVLEAALNMSATEIQAEIPDCDYGIVAILGQSHPEEEPMKPETMIRNAGYNTKEYQEKALQDFRKMWKNAEMVTRKHTDDLPEGLYDNDIKSILSLQGTIVGGSGVPFSKEEYLKSVEFWDKNCTVK